MSNLHSGPTHQLCVALMQINCKVAQSLESRLLSLTSGCSGVLGSPAPPAGIHSQHADVGDKPSETLRMHD